LKTEIYMLPLPQVIAVPLSILFVKVHVKYVLHYYYYYYYPDKTLSPEADHLIGRKCSI
jgi:hypothetical protein